MSGKKIVIFYLDDEPEICENFVELFGTNNMSIRYFLDYKEMKAAAQLAPPDMIFFDYRLPGITGDVAAKEFDPAIPKFLISGEINLTTDFPFKKIINKPYEISEILSLFKQYLP